MDLTKADMITVDLTDLCRLDPYYGAVPPMSVTMDANTMPNTYISGSTSPYTFNDLTIGTALQPNGSGTISLTGDDADIKINGESLLDMIRGIQDRLNILAPDPGMEQEWSELADLREQYEAKLAECRVKSKMWKTLQSMPPPDIE